MTQFQAIIFDMDGLLLDTERIALTAFLETCGHLGIPERRDVFTRCIGTNQLSGHEVLRQGLGGEVDHVLFEQVWNSRYDAYTTGCAIALKPGAAELLQYISSLEIPTAVATSTSTARAQEKLRNSGILNRFDVIVGGDQVRNSKPAPDIYLRAAAILKAQARACLALEDSENGVRSAMAAGMTVVQIPDLVPPSDDLLALGHTVLRSLVDVATFSSGHLVQANSTSSRRDSGFAR